MAEILEKQKLREINYNWEQIKHTSSHKFDEFGLLETAVYNKQLKRNQKRDKANPSKFIIILNNFNVYREFAINKMVSDEKHGGLGGGGNIFFFNYLFLTFLYPFGLCGGRRDPRTGFSAMQWQRVRCDEVDRQTIEPTLNRSTSQRLREVEQFFLAKLDVHEPHPTLIRQHKMKLLMIIMPVVIRMVMVTATKADVLVVIVFVVAPAAVLRHQPIRSEQLAIFCCLIWWVVLVVVVVVVMLLL